jgi:tol-pal system protein YbgF
MKYTVLPLALMISMFSAAEDGWVAVGQAPAAKPAVKPAVSQQSNSPSPAKPSLQVELSTMVEMMQQEIAELRGTVEEQNHKIEILQKQQQQRYLDLDRRMADLLNTPIAVVNSNGDVTSNVLPADDLYASAMSLIKKKDFTRALEQLDLLAKTYPKHALAANAFYWSGEVQLAEGNFELAIKQFETVLYQHPDHNKAADSHYKLAVSYDRSGNAAKATELLQQVIKQYPGISDSAVRLAERYLARLQGT